MRALLGYLCRHRAPCCDRIRGRMRVPLYEPAVRLANAVCTRVTRARARTHVRTHARTLASRQTGKQAGEVTDWRLVHTHTHTRTHYPRALNYPGVNINRGNDVPIANRCTNYANTALRERLYFRRVCQYVTPGTCAHPPSRPSALFTRPLALSPSPSSDGVRRYMQTSVSA